MDFDIIVVGAGISGLMAAYRISQRDQKTKIVILEASDRVGGRLLFKDFHDTNVPLGGSIIRNSDHRVLNLCRELGLEVGGFTSRLQSRNHVWVNQFISRIKEQMKGVEPTPSESVYEYLVRNFPPEEVDLFINNSTYRDFVDGNMRQFVRNYPLDDLIQPEGDGQEMFYVQGGYGKLVSRVVQLVRQNPNIKIHLETRVESLTYDGEGVQLQTSQGDAKSRFLVWATGEQSYSSLPRNLQGKLHHVIGIPFIRVYGFSSVPVPDFPELVTPGVIGKVFPKTDKVFQIAYVEGDWAVRLAAMLAAQGTKSKQVDLMRQLLFQSLGREIPLTDIVYQYWSSGIHQFMKNKEGVVEDGLVVVIGEAVSTNQGWVEGCVETVDFIMSNYERYFTRHPVPNHYSALHYLP
jgi:2-polyprenyl-6-methoxyphenol hydroxylase-like FAD-dependent oxidoreductase